MFGPLKYIFYLIILAILGYVGLLVLPNFIGVEQVETRQVIAPPQPQLLDEN